MLFLLNMCFALKVLLFLLSQKELGRVWAKDQPGHWYNVEHQDKWPRLDVQTNRAQRSTSGHAMFNREVLGGDLTINTLPDNMTDLEDSEKYYTWRSFGPEDQRTHELWVDMNDLQLGQVRMHGILSNTHKQAARVALSFDFPFYGHYLRQVTIATGGFIFMGDVTHRMLTATQYIAPLMANFDPSYSKESTVQYLDNGDVFVVQWEKVRLRGRESEGAFTFQTALYRTGTITFSYKDIPLPVKVISSPEHPVKAGLSDGLMVLLPSPQALDIQGRAIFEYHRIEIDVRKITNHSAFEFTALATCLQHKSCEACLSSNQTSGCSWCNVLQRCSDGTDRHRQEWLDYNCSEEGRNVTCEEYSRGEIDSFTDPYSTSYSGTPTAVSPQRNGCETNDDSKNEILLNGNDLKTSASKNKEMLANTGVIAGVVAAVVLLSAMILLALYINSHPNAASPLYLIQRRNNFWTSMTFRKKGLQPSYTEVEGDGHERDSIVEAGPC